MNPLLSKLLPLLKTVCSLRFLFVLLFSQFLSLIITSTGIFSTFLNDRNISIPTAQSALNYVALSLFYTPILLIYNFVQYKRKRRKSQSQDKQNLTSSYIDDDPSSTVAAASPDLTSEPPKPWYSFFKLRQHFLKYLLIAVADVEANYVVVKAYGYTTITSIMLLDCFSIPCVMILSRILLKVKFKWTHYVGVLLCLVGLGSLIFSDYLNSMQKKTDGTSSNEDSSPSTINVLIGDALCLLGAALYSISNVGQEYSLKRERVAHRKKLEQQKRLQQQQGEQQLAQARTPEETTPISAGSASSPRAFSSNKHSGNNIHLTNVIAVPASSAAVTQAIEAEEAQLQAAVATASTTTATTPVTSDSSAADKRQATIDEIINGVEYLSMVGTLGSIIGIVQLLILERNEISSIFQQQHGAELGAIIGLLLGFGSVMFLLYSLVPHFLRLSSATFMNLSFLASDLYAVITSIFLFNTYPHWLYYISFIITVCGLVLYNYQSEEEQDQEQNGTQ